MRAALRSLVLAGLFLGAAAAGRAQTAPAVAGSANSVLLVDEGADATLSWSVTGTPPYACAWRRDGQVVATTTATSATLVSLVVPAVRITDSSTWQVEVSNAAGAAVGISRALVVRPATAPTIRDQPGPAPEGSMGVTAAGSAPLSYQWRRDSVPIQGATANYALTNHYTVNGQLVPGDYTCEVANRVGRVVSTVARISAVTLPVPTAPVIRTQPAAVNFYPVNEEASLDLSVVAFGVPFPSYQWRKDGVAISGATNSFHSLLRTLPGTAGDYSVVVSNALGSVTSQTVRVALGPARAPAITRHPRSIVLKPGTTPAFSVTLEARDIGERFQWRRDGVALVGATNGVLAAANLSPGRYDVVVSNALGAVTSEAAPLTFVRPDYTPWIESQPVSIGVRAGEGGTSSDFLNIGVRPATGLDEVARIDWRRDGVLLSPTSTGVSGSESVVGFGRYTATVVTRLGETETSEPARLLDLDAERAPWVVKQPAGGTRLAGANVTLSVVAQGEQPLVYRWTREGAVVAGATGATLTLPVATVADSGVYVVTVSNRLGTATSAAARLTIDPAAPPVIARQPTGVARLLGETAILAVTVPSEDNTTTTWQWYRDGVAVAGTTSSLLTLSNLSAAQTGRWTVVARDSVGRTVESEAAEVTLIGRQTPGPRVTLSPTDQALRTGDCATLVCDAESGSARRYQWFKDGVAMGGATRQALFLANVTPADAGRYRVDVADQDGVAASREAVVSVTAGEPRPLAPLVLAAGVGTRVTEGAPMVLTVDVVGNPGPTIRWLKNGVVIAGATGSTLTIPAAALADAGNYQAEIVTATGAQRLPAATVTVTARVIPPTITLASATRWEVSAGGSVALQALFSGPTGTSVSWRRSGAFLGNGRAITTNASGVSAFEIGGVSNDGIQLADAGSYVATVSSAGVSAQTAAVEVRVVPAEVAGLYLSPRGDRVTAAVMIAPDRRVSALVGAHPVPGHWVTTVGRVDETGLLAATAVDPAAPGGTRVVRGWVRGESLRLTADASLLDVTMKRASVAGPFAACSGMWTVPLPAELGGTMQVAVAATGEVVATVTAPGLRATVRDDFVAGQSLNLSFLGALSASLALAPNGMPPALELSIVASGRATTVQAVRLAGPLTNRFANIATRGRAGAGADAMFAGFVLAGDAPGAVLVRAIGPALAGFGVPGTLGDPRLELFSGAVRTAANDNWGGAADVAAAAARVGAFALPAGSADAALLTTLAPGAYTAQVSAPAGATSGEALVEIYNTAPPTAARLINLSTRGRVAGEAVLLSAGIVITGDAPKRVLVRAIGPALQAFGVAEALADPRLRIVRGDATVAENDDWWTRALNSAEVTTASAAVGAFALPAFFKDAALVATLAPGNYTAVVSGGTAQEGTALIEVYELP